MKDFIIRNYDRDETVGGGRWGCTCQYLRKGGFPAMSKSYFLSEQKIRQLNLGETKKLQPHLMPLCSSRSMTTFDTIA